MIEEADAVVIGAGAFGASVAYHLARRGIKRVALVEKFAIASQTSRRAAGLTGQNRSTEAMTRLAALAVRKIAHFTAETGEPLVFHQTGSLKIARIPEHEAQLHDEVERGQRLGLDVDFISPSEAAMLSPFLRPDGIRAVSYMQSDLYLDPWQLPLAYARAAERLGATLLPHTAVTEIAMHDGAVTGVVMEQGTIRTPVVVDTAGAWTRQIGAMVGLRIPLVPTRHQLVITDPIDGVADAQPIVRIIDVNLYVRPERGGLMFGGYEPDPLQVEMDQLPPGFQIADLVLDLGVLRQLAARVAEQLPVLQDFTVREHRGGLPTMTPDGKHLIGPLPGVHGFWVASGCCVGGLSISPAVGEVLADWIIEGEPGMDLSLCAPDRFGPEYQSDAALADACRWQYAYHYSA
ncbi:MAG: NAD(P)/FAD-dependent oxidoreductase [Thermomicrobiales bacterium]